MTSPALNAAALIRMRCALDAVLSEHDAMTADGPSPDAATALSRATTNLATMVSSRLGADEQLELTRLGLAGSEVGTTHLNAAALSGWLTGHLNAQTVAAQNALVAGPAGRAGAPDASSARSAEMSRRRDVGPRMAGGYL